MQTEVYTYTAKYLDQLREYAPIYRANYLREILQNVRDGKPAPEKDPQLYVYKCISNIFRDADESLRKNTINYFIQVELPSLASEEQEEKARCDAIDNLLECLNDKSAKEINDLLRQL